MTARKKPDDKNSDHTVPPDNNWTPEKDLGDNPVQNEPSGDLGPETGPQGTDMESNVPGRSKPASEPVDNAATDEPGRH